MSIALFLLVYLGTFGLLSVLGEEIEPATATRLVTGVSDMTTVTFSFEGVPSTPLAVSSLNPDEVITNSANAGFIAFYLYF